MRGFDDPEDPERTVAESGEDAETASLPGTLIAGPGGRHRPRTEEPTTLVNAQAPRPRSLQPPATRHAPPADEAVTAEHITTVRPGGVAAQPPTFQPPPFPRRSKPSPAAPEPAPLRPEPATSPSHPTPVLHSRIESFRDPEAGQDGPRTFAPIASRAPEAPVAAEDLRGLAPPSPTEATTQPRAGASQPPPAWVVGYLLLCAGLTLVGVVVLYFEHRMLSGSPR